MVMRNDLDRFHLVMDVIDRVPGLAIARGLAAPAPRRRAAARPGLHPRARRGPTRRSATGPGRRERSTTVRILVLNPGSATLKATVLDLPERRPRASSARSTGLVPERRRRSGTTVGRSRRRSPRPASRRTGSRRSATASSTAASRFTEAVLIDDDVVVADRRAGRPGAAAQPDRGRDDPRGRGRPPGTSRTWPRSTRPSTPPLPEAAWRYPVPDDWVDRRRRPALRLPRPVGRVVGGRAPPSCSTGPRPTSASSSRISAAAARSPRSMAVGRSTPRWG